MIAVGTTMNPADNSGAKKLKLVGIPGASRIRFARVGDVVTVVVKGASSVGVVKDHTVVKAVIVRVKKEYRRKDGSHIRFSDNAAVVINKDKQLVGTRIFGPIAREVRERGFVKVASLAKEVW